MIDLSTNYMGMKLKSPIVAASSDVTNSIANLKKLEASGAGAAILKSLFEEEIIMEMEEMMHEMTARPYVFPETKDYLDETHEEDSVRSYLHFIEDAKKEVSMPLIASINCVSDQKWIYLAEEIEKAGADGLELNVFTLPSDFSRNSEEKEKLYFDIIEQVKSRVNIPVALKISYYFSNLGQMIKRLSETKVDAMVLFNRSYSPDIDLDNMKLIAANVLSRPQDITVSLRWIAIMANRVSCDLAASTGVHDGKGVLKQLAAGADVVQVASVLYKYGPEYVKTMIDEMQEWMEDKMFSSVDSLRGRLSQEKATNPADFERVQFIKNFTHFVLKR